MNYPTKEHEEYIEYMKQICNANRLSLILKGSLAHGTAKKYSDIDLLLTGDLTYRLTGSLLEKIITGYDKLVMTNLTENPDGIYVLNYENGISVDLDIRRSLYTTDILKYELLCLNGILITDELERRFIPCDCMPERPDWYKTIRLIHRCCVKYLCGKVDVAQGLTEEVRTAIDTLIHEKIDESDSIKLQMKSAFEAIEKNYPVDEGISKLLGNLFQAMDDMEEQK